MWLCDPSCVVAACLRYGWKSTVVLADLIRYDFSLDLKRAFVINLHLFIAHCNLKISLYELDRMVDKITTTGLVFFLQPFSIVPIDLA